MTEPRDPQPEEHDSGTDPTDIGADTQRFRAFVQREEFDEAPVERSGSGFRLLTLAVGLLVFALIVWALLR